MSSYIVIRVEGSLEDAQKVREELEAFMWRMDVPGAHEPGSDYDPHAIDGLAERENPVTLSFDVTQINEASAATAAKTDEQVAPRGE